MRPNVRTFGGESPAASFVKFVVATVLFFPLVRDRQHFERLASCFFRASVIARRGFRVGMSDNSRHRDNVHARGQRVANECTA